MNQGDIRFWDHWTQWSRWVKFVVEQVESCQGELRVSYARTFRPFHVPNVCSFRLTYEKNYHTHG